MKKKKIFQLTDTEVSSTIHDILEKYKFLFSSRQSFSNIKKFEKFQKNYHRQSFSLKTFKKLVAFIRPFKYHHNTYNKLEPENLKTLEKYLLNKWYQSRIEDSSELKLGVSAYFKAITRFFDKIIEGQSRKKMMILSGHDTNIVNFLSNILHPELLRKKINDALLNKDDFTFLVPPLASSILLELYKSDESGKLFIKIIYNGEEIKQAQLRIPVSYSTADEAYDYSDFKKLLKSRIKKSYRKLVCGKRVLIMK